MKKLAAVFILALASVAYAANDEITTSGWYNALYQGGGGGFVFQASYFSHTVSSSGTTYVMESDGDGGYRYRNGNDWYTFDVVAGTWTYYDEGYATFGGSFQSL